MGRDLSIVGAGNGRVTTIIAYHSRLSRTFPLLSRLIRNVGAGTVVLLVLLLIALSITLRLGVGSR